MSNETRVQPCVNPGLLTQSIHPALYPLQQSLCEYPSPISRVYTRSGFEIASSTTVTSLLAATHSSYICAEQTANQQKKDKSILFVCLKWTKKRREFVSSFLVVFLSLVIPSPFTGRDSFPRSLEILLIES